MMYSRSEKRSVMLGGLRTSVSLEEPFWLRLKEIAARRKVLLSTVIEEINQQGESTNLSSAIRTFILHDVDQQLEECRRRLRREHQNDASGEAD